MNISNVSRLNNSNFTSVKRIDTTSKRMENVDYLLKIERKNRQQQQLMFEKKIQKIDLELDTNQNELKNAIQNLNQKKKQYMKFKKQI